MTEQVNGVVTSKARTGKSIQVNGNWYGAYSPETLNAVNRGDTVAFQSKKSKCGRFNNISGAVTVSGEDAAPAAQSSAPAPQRQYGNQGRTFPVGALAPERTINRQNALTNAVAFTKDNVEISPQEVIDIARLFEAYTTGDIDQAEAEAALAEMGG